jgi:hypothetical protein
MSFCGINLAAVCTRTDDIALNRSKEDVMIKTISAMTAAAVFVAFTSVLAQEPAPLPEPVPAPTPAAPVPMSPAPSAPAPSADAPKAEGKKEGKGKHKAKGKGHGKKKGHHKQKEGAQ